MTQAERKRIFNLGYYTWVEQRDIALEDFDAREKTVVLGRYRWKKRMPGMN